jgi:3-hydroxyisobutyrate dehydrogenase-like beta-hydroxyacid dehydrogenase
MKNEKIGFIGIGQMGKSMALNLVRAGYKVYVFDANEKAIQQIKRNGIISCSSCKDVALKVDDTVLIMVRDTQQVKDVILSEEGILSSAKERLNIIVTSTINPSTAKELGEVVSKAKCKMVNAPVSGGTHGAEKGTLTLMVSGNKELYTKAKPIFEAIGKKVFYFGPRQESGQGAKLANNLMAGINMQGCIEGFGFAERMGIPEKTFKELVSVSTGNSWVIQNLEWFKAVWAKECNQKEPPLMHKDLLYVINESSIPLPMTSLAAQLFLSKNKF